MEGVDYAGSRPDPVRLYAAGKRFVVRYGGAGGAWKHLGSAEADDLRRAGLHLVANVEGSADGMLGGWSTGKSWASAADAHFRSVGMPADRPIYLSVDFNVTSSQWPKVADALRGAASVIGARRVGIYGSYDAVRWAARDGGAAWFWQTYAWSRNKSGNTQWFGSNHIEQYHNGVTVAGVDVDLCRSRKADFGQWGQEDTVDASDVWAYDPNKTDARGAVRNRTFQSDYDTNPTVAARYALEEAWEHAYLAHGEARAARADVAKLADQLTALAAQLGVHDAADAQRDAEIIALLQAHADGSLDADAVVRRIGELLSAGSPSA